MLTLNQECSSFSSSKQIDQSIGVIKMSAIFGEVVFYFNNEFEPDMNPQSNGGSGSAGGCGGSGGCGGGGGCNGGSGGCGGCGGGSAINPPEDNS